MSLKHMVLGCLIDAPSHGYEIRRRFIKFYRCSHGVNEGQLYTTLKKMEQEGMISKEVVYQEKNPPRKVFHPTEKGREDFYHWLMEKGEVSDIADFDFFHVFPFLEKCTYFNHLTGKETLPLVERQAAVEKAKLDEFNRVRGKMLERKVHHFRVSVIEFGIALQEIKLAWLEELRAKILALRSEGDIVAEGPLSN